MPARTPFFARSLQDADTWLADLGHHLGTEDESVLYAVLKAVLHALRDRLPVEDAARLAAAMPMLMRGLYFEGWEPGPAAQPAAPPAADEADLLAEVERRLGGRGGIAAEAALRGVLRVLARHLDAGGLDGAAKVLPEGLIDADGRRAA
ncbi:MAG TPA: DUF2267 domain-containing protein [Azospirillaceae bacterium]|nr:DUF2267 domain-containing protein [Azospirillaceae bacterium]